MTLDDSLALIRRMCWGGAVEISQATEAWQTLVEHREQLIQKNYELTERSRWWNECRQDAEVRLGRLAEAARPYVEHAAPHEQLFSGEDLHNFQRLEAALADADSLLSGEVAT